MERLTFEGNFCDISMCLFDKCPGICSQKEVWERLKAYEDAEEQGRWTEKENKMYYAAMKENVIWFSYICSECSFEAMSSFPYCPNCGAKMEG